MQSCKSHQPTDIAMLQQEEDGDKAEQSGAEPSAEEQALQQQQQEAAALQVQPLLHKKLCVYELFFFIRTRLSP